MQQLICSGGFDMISNPQNMRIYTIEFLSPKNFHSNTTSKIKTITNQASQTWLLGIRILMVTAILRELRKK